MNYSYSVNNDQGVIRMLSNTVDSDINSYKNDSDPLLSIVWNRGKKQRVRVDDHTITCEENEVLVFNKLQIFRFSSYENLIIWQFNRPFYCIIDHDHEVSCAGLLFFGSRQLPKIKLAGRDLDRFYLLQSVFREEFEEEDDNLKTEMLRMLLKRLIVKLTRLYKNQQHLNQLATEEMDLVRNFNVLVEKHYKSKHQVQDYADLLNKSPKTISNLFVKYGGETPL
ncbi:MAG: AraC family transcriptional regulator, partial [Bacteroidota bacterium]